MKTQILAKYNILLLLASTIAIVLPILHIPYLVVINPNLELTFIYMYTILLNQMPSIWILMTLSLIKDLLNADLILISLLNYMIFSKLALLCMVIINKKAFWQIWLGFIFSFIVGYIIPLLVKSFLAQIWLLNKLALAEISIAIFAFPLLYILVNKRLFGSWGIKNSD
jgi:hypothetical protein